MLQTATVRFTSLLKTPGRVAGHGGSMGAGVGAGTGGGWLGGSGESQA